MRVLLKILVLLTVSSVGWASRPNATALVDSSGSYTIVMQPSSGWEVAEIQVGDDLPQALGPVDDGELVTLRGRTATLGKLRVLVHAARSEREGFTWAFEVTPDAVPIEMPKVEADLTHPVPARLFRRGL